MAKTFTDIFQSIWEDVFMKEFLWVKIRRFQIPTE